MQKFECMYLFSGNSLYFSPQYELIIVKQKVVINNAKLVAFLSNRKFIYIVFSTPITIFKVNSPVNKFMKV